MTKKIIPQWHLNLPSFKYSSVNSYIEVFVHCKYTNWQWNLTFFWTRNRDRILGSAMPSLRIAEHHSQTQQRRCNSSTCVYVCSRPARHSGSGPRSRSWQSQNGTTQNCSPEKIAQWTAAGMWRQVSKLHLTFLSFFPFFLLSFLPSSLLSFFPFSALTIKHGCSFSSLPSPYSGRNCYESVLNRKYITVCASLTGRGQKASQAYIARRQWRLRGSKCSPSIL